MEMPRNSCLTQFMDHRPPEPGAISVQSFTHSFVHLLELCVDKVRTNTSRRSPSSRCSIAMWYERREWDASEMRIIEARRSGDLETLGKQPRKSA